jgi:hypothetical protein
MRPELRSLNGIGVEGNPAAAFTSSTCITLERMLCANGVLWLV